jgi:predicted GNAT family N-acyltransferase
VTRGYTVSLTDWHASGKLIRQVRNAVFIMEQGVPKALEWDDSDPHCTHVIAVIDSGSPVGTGRLLPDGTIGRMAVVKHWRGHGVGDAMLTCLIDEARRQGRKRVKLSSQQQAVGFYLRHHFITSGSPYMEAGIPHIAMSRDIS